jgi:hypothetical protein
MLQKSLFPWLVVAIKPETVMLLFYILKEWHNKRCTFFCSLLSHANSGPRIKWQYSLATAVSLFLNLGFNRKYQVLMSPN